MRPIDADALIDFIDVEHLRHQSELCFSEIDVVNLLLHALTADVAPVVHGRWVMKETMIRSPYAKNTYCSKCFYETGNTSNYCPNCGCRMDEDEGESDGTKS